MLVHPMIGSWEPPRLERIRARESRRLATLPVIGLSGDLQQDLGRGAIEVEISGSLVGDEHRDEFLKQLREQYLEGAPVDFVADIVGESELEQVLIHRFEVEEVAGSADTFRYHIVLREYTEPPEPAGLSTDFGAELDADLDLEALAGLDLLDLPGLLGSVPDIGDLLSPVETAAQELNDTLSSAGTLLDPLRGLLNGSGGS